MDNAKLYNEEIEQALLGCILVEPKLMKKTIDIISPNDFYFNEHILIYKAMVTNYHKNILNDYATVTKQLQSMDKLEVAGDVDYQVKLSDSVPSTANIDSYIQITKELSIKRYWLEKTNIIQKYIHKYNADEIKEYVKEKFIDMELVSNEEVQFMSDEIDEYLDYLDKPMESGKETLYPTLDDMLLIKDTDLITIAGRPGSGKSAFKANLINNYCRQGYYVTDISLEMDKNSSKNRLYSNIAEVRNKDIQFKRLDIAQKQRIKDAVAQTKEYNLNIYDKPITVEHICNYAKVLKQKGKLDILFIDHALLVDTNKQLKRNEQVNYISWKLKSLAMDLKIPVIMLTQLSRSSEKENRRPNKTDLKESGGIEENSNAIILLHNKSDTKDNDYRSNPVNFIDVIIEKNRDGEIGTIPYHFNKDYQRFIETKYDYNTGKFITNELKEISNSNTNNVDDISSMSSEELDDILPF